MKLSSNPLQIRKLTGRGFDSAGRLSFLTFLTAFIASPFPPIPGPSMPSSDGVWRMIQSMFDIANDTVSGIVAAVSYYLMNPPEALGNTEWLRYLTDNIVGLIHPVGLAVISLLLVAIIGTAGFIARWAMRKILGVFIATAAIPLVVLPLWATFVNSMLAWRHDLTRLALLPSTETESGISLMKAPAMTSAGSGIMLYGLIIFLSMVLIGIIYAYSFIVVGVVFFGPFALLLRFTSKLGATIWRWTVSIGIVTAMIFGIPTAMLFTQIGQAINEAGDPSGDSMAASFVIVAALTLAIASQFALGIGSSVLYTKMFGGSSHAFVSGRVESENHDTPPITAHSEGYGSSITTAPTAPSTQSTVSPQPEPLVAPDAATVERAQTASSTVNTAPSSGAATTVAESGEAVSTVQATEEASSDGEERRQS